MTICYFGDYDPAYSRNRVLVQGLAYAGVRVIPCRSTGSGPMKFMRLAKLYRTLPAHDLVLVGYSDSRFIAPLARLISSKPIIWDAFYSLYDSWVSDRQLVAAWHPKAWWYWCLDFLNTHIVDAILLDTNEHIQYFVTHFGADPKKCIRALVGTDETVFSPVPQPRHGRFLVGFYGKYIPLHGVDTIVRAAQLLPEIQFVLIGSGQTYAASRALASKLGTENVEFRERIGYTDLPAFIASCDVMLGVFGTSEKTSRVIPNKVYEAAAMGKAIISARTPGIRELFTDGNDILLVEAGSPTDLAAAIERLVEEPVFRESLGMQARATFERAATSAKIGERLAHDIGSLLFPTLQV